jgi:hypothetical protein
MTGTGRPEVEGPSRTEEHMPPDIPLAVAGRPSISSKCSPPRLPQLLAAHDIPGELFSFAAIVPEAEQTGTQEEHPMLAFKATLYLHEARKEPDWDDFKTAMDKEFTDQMANQLPNHT